MKIGNSIFKISILFCFGLLFSYAAIAQYTPPIVTLTFNPNPVTIGQNSTFTWAASNYAVGCNGTPTTAISGTKVYPITTTTDWTYTVTCYGPGGNTTRSIVLKVLPANPASFTSSMSGNSVSLSWASAPGATGYQVYRGTTLIGSPAGTGLTDSSVSVGVTYSYSVKACNANGCSGGASSSITIPSPTPKPKVTVSFSPNPATIGQITTLTWSSENATSCPDAPDGKTSGSKVYPVLTTSNWNFPITCNGAGGSTTGSSTLIVIPANPANLTGSASGTSVALTWNSSSGASNYQVYRGSSLIASPTGTSYTDTGLTQGNTYTYTVKACNSNGCSGGASTPVLVPAPTPKPKVTLSFSPNPVTIGQFSTLTWSSENATSCPDSPDGKTSGSKTYPIQTTSNWTFSITCNGPGGSTPASTTLIVIPANPANIKGSTSGTSITLTWDSSPGASHYQVYRGSSLVSSPTGTVFTDTGLIQGNTYVYTVKACNANNCSSGESKQISLPLPSSSSSSSTPLPSSSSSSVPISSRSSSSVLSSSRSSSSTPLLSSSSSSVPISSRSSSSALHGSTRKVIFIHTDLLGSPAAETTSEGTTNE